MSVPLDPKDRLSLKEFCELIQDSDADQRVLKVDRGEDDLIQPRLMAEIEVHWGEG